MKMNFTVDLNAEKIAELTDHLPQKEFSRVKKLIDDRARSRFKVAMELGRKEFKKAKLTRKDALEALAETYAKP